MPDTWKRVAITLVEPQVDGGVWPIRRVVGESVDVLAGVIADGHDLLAVELVWQHEDGEEQTTPMPLRYNNEYVATFEVDQLGRYSYRVNAWVDQFGTWQDQFRRRMEGGEPDDELRSELLEGAAIIRKTLKKARGRNRKLLKAYAEAFEDGGIENGLSEDLASLARRYDPREGMVESQTFEVAVDPVQARFAAWYEFFPRSAGNDPTRHATLDDAAERLPRIKELGFDVVYLPPIHPVGITFRKGKDNIPLAEENDPGSPWAIGGDRGDGTAGGHKSVHPDLGGIEAFDRFVARADELGLKVALDIAFQTSPDHPYVKAHPEWFRQRPDGTIRYAENPPKKYQDVYPFDFESADWQGLWKELRSIFSFWIGHGVTVFRVDNPHTKSLPFWEWCIESLRRAHPDLIFLAEAFTAPKMMYGLAKRGFNNSYTYFAWRNSKQELTEYCEELFQTNIAEYYRPNFWPNTPDIFTDYLAEGGRPAHVIRFVLAATLSSVYGIYGPPYEHVFSNKHPAREEYAENEKYEIRTWNWNDPTSLQPLMKRVNRIRRENPALQHMRNIRFHEVDNPNLMAYTKETPDNLILCVVNLDPFQTHHGWVQLPLWELGLPEHDAFEVHDLLGGERYYWQGTHNFVNLNPHVLPAHIFHIHRA